MTGPRITIFANAGPDVGGGHVMRCLTLAQALDDLGARCAFKDFPAVRMVLDAFAPGTALATGSEPADAVIFDSYELSASAQRRLALGRPTLVIDDLADRPLACDLLLDAGPARRPTDYTGLAPLQATLLLGPAYAPVRPQFAALRAATLAWRAQTGAVERILVTLGLTDLHGISERVLSTLLPLAGEAHIDLVVGSGAESLPRLRALAVAQPGITLHVDTHDMAGLTADADLAIGAGGSSTWERCVLGLPSILLILADNQQPAADAMARFGAAVVVDARTDGFDTALGMALRRLLSDTEQRKSLSRISRVLCDGRGAERVAEAFLARIGAG